MYKTYLINLESRPDRLERMSSILTGAGIEFEVFPAIDGRKLKSANGVLQFVDGTPAYDPDHSTRLGYRPLSPSGVGCYLSHLEVWRKAAKSNDGWALVLEDDLNIDPSVGPILKNIPGIEKGWDFIKLSALGKVPYVQLFPLTENHFISLLLRGSTGMQGYCISAQGARKLLSKALPITLPVDTFIDHFWHTGINTLAVTPYPIEDNKNIESSIEIERLTLSNTHKYTRLPMKTRVLCSYRKTSNAFLKKLYFLIYAIKSILIRQQLKP